MTIKHDPSPERQILKRSDKMSTEAKASTMGVHLTRGQPDPKIWQKCQLKPKPQLWGYIWPKVSLTERSDKNVNLSWSLNKGGTSDQWSAWSEVWPNVNLTHSLILGVHLTKGQPDLKIWQKCQSEPKLQLWGVHLTQCKKDIWKFEHTLYFMLCFIEVFFYERPIIYLILFMLNQSEWHAFHSKI